MSESSTTGLTELLLEQQHRIKELEAERDRVMRDNGKLNCHIDDLEAERDRLREEIKHAVRVLSFGGDAEVMYYLSKALEETT